MEQLSSNKGFNIIPHLCNNLYDVYENNGLVKIVDNVNRTEYYSNEEELKHKSIDRIVEDRSNEDYMFI